MIWLCLTQLRVLVPAGYGRIGGCECDPTDGEREGAPAGRDRCHERVCLYGRTSICLFVVISRTHVCLQVEEEVRVAGVKFFEPKPLTRQRLLQVLWQIATQRTPPASPRVAGSNTTENVGIIGQLFTQTGASLALNSSMAVSLPVDEQQQWIARVDSKIYLQVEKEFLPRTRERLQRLPMLSVDDDGDRAQLQREAEAICTGAATYGLNTVRPSAVCLFIGLLFLRVLLLVG